MNNLMKGDHVFDLNLTADVKFPRFEDKKVNVTNTFVKEMKALNEESEALKAELQIIESCVDKAFSLQDWLEIKQLELDRMTHKKQKLIDKNCEFWAGQTNA